MCRKLCFQGSVLSWIIVKSYETFSEHDFYCDDDVCGLFWLKGENLPCGVSEFVWLWPIACCALSHYRQLWGNQNCNCPHYKQYKYKDAQIQLETIQIQNTKTYKYSWSTAPISEVRWPNKPDSLSTAQSHLNIIVQNWEGRILKDIEIWQSNICTFER